MQTAVMLFIASSVGVSVGWQPMPDGSPRYEYVVQLDRELLATLKQGASIPISSEVPDDIRPIARIRIVVGDENLPRQKLVAQFKPWPEGPLRASQSREGLVETQHVVPSDAANIAPRYEIQPIFPADSSQPLEWPKTETPDRTVSDSQWPNSPPPPEIRREMLDGPANAELRTANGGLVSPTPASFPQSTAQPTAPLPPQSTVISQPQTAGPTGGSPSGSVFPLLLAWVLLSGSGAGNLYLFWSYLDIRNKYRGLIRTAGRHLGRRDAEEEYEDEDYDE